MSTYSELLALLDEKEQDKTSWQSFSESVPTDQFPTQDAPIEKDPLAAFVTQAEEEDRSKARQGQLADQNIQILKQYESGGRKSVAGRAKEDAQWDAVAPDKNDSFLGGVNKSLNRQNMQEGEAAEGAAGMMAAGATGVVKGATELGQNVVDLNSAFYDTVGLDGVAKPLDDISKSIEGFQDETLRTPHNSAEQLTEGLSQFALPYVGAEIGLAKAGMFSRGALSWLNKPGAREVVRPSVVAATITPAVFDPKDGNIANMLVEAGIGEEYFKYLASDPNDSEALATIKMMITDVPLGIGIDALTPILRGARNRVAMNRMLNEDFAWNAGDFGVEFEAFSAFDVPKQNSRVMWEITPTTPTTEAYPKINLTDEAPLNEVIDEDAYLYTMKDGKPVLNTPTPYMSLLKDDQGSIISGHKDFRPHYFFEDGTPVNPYVSYDSVNNQEYINDLAKYHEWETEFEKGNIPDHPNGLGKDTPSVPEGWPAGTVDYLRQRGDTTLFDWEQANRDARYHGRINEDLWVEVDGKPIQLKDLRAADPSIDVAKGINLEQAYYGNDGAPKGTPGKGAHEDPLFERDPNKKYGPLGENFWKMSKPVIKALKKWRKSTDGENIIRDGGTNLYTPENTGTPKERQELSKEVVRELYHNGQALRDFLRPYADKDGYLWLYRGTENYGPESGSSIRSYSTRPGATVVFGERIYADKVHIKDIVNVGVPEEGELLVRTPFNRTDRKNVMPGLPKVEEKVVPFTGTPKAANDNIDLSTVRQDNGETTFNPAFKLGGQTLSKTGNTISPPGKFDPVTNPGRFSDEAANDNMPGGGMQADAEVPPPETGEGWYLGRDSNGNFRVVLETGHYITIPDKPGTKLNFNVTGLAQAKNLPNDTSVWAKVLGGAKDREEILSIVETPIPQFTRNDLGEYVSDNSRHKITRVGKNKWALTSDTAATGSVPVEVMPGMTQGTPAPTKTTQVFRTLGAAQTAAGKVEKAAIENTPSSFPQRPLVQSTPYELETTKIGNDMFISTLSAEEARRLDEIAKAGGSAKKLTAITALVSHNLKRDIMDDALYFQKLGINAFGVDFTRVEDLKKIFDAKMDLDKLAPNDPLRDVIDRLGDPSETPWAVHAKTASTTFRTSSFLNEATFTHPGEPLNIFDVVNGKETLVKKADDRIIKYQKLATKPHNKIYQEVIDKYYEDGFMEFQSYISARRAKFLHLERGIDSPWTKPDANGIPLYQKVIDNVTQDGVKLTDYNKSLDNLQDYFRDVLNYAKEAGVLSDASYKRIVEMNTPKDGSKTLYLPMYYEKTKWSDKIVSALGGGRMKTLKGISPDDAVEKGLRLLTPFEAGAKYTMMMVRAADLNYSKLVAMRYIEDANKRGFSGVTGVEFASPELTRAAVPNWSMQDALEKQMKALLGNDDGKTFLEGMRQALGDELGLSSKEVSDMMDSGYTSLIAFGKGREFTDKNGEKVFIDMFMDHDKGPRLFKVTDPDAIAYFSNGGQLPNDPTQYYGLLQKAYKWGIEMPARAVSYAVTYHPAFLVNSARRDINGRTVNSLLLKGGLTRDLRSNWQAAKAIYKAATDGEEMWQLYVSGGSFNRRAEVYTGAGLDTALKEITGGTKLKGVDFSKVPFDLKHPFSRRNFNKLWRKTWNGVDTPFEWYRNVVEKAEMTVARAAEAALAREAGMSAEMGATLSREVSTDLARRGSAPLVRKLTRSVSFLGGNISGLYRMSKRYYVPVAFSKEAMATGDIPRAWTNTNMNKFATGMAVLGAKTAAVTWFVNKYYEDERRRVPKEIKEQFNLYPRFADPEQALKDIMQGKTPELADYTDPFVLTPKSYDHRIGQNILEGLMDTPEGRYPDLKKVFSRAVASLMPAQDIVPTSLDPIWGNLVNEDAFGNPLVDQKEYDSRLSEDVAKANTYAMSKDLAASINSLKGIGQPGVTATAVDAVAKFIAPGILRNMMDQMDYQYRKGTDDIQMPPNSRRFQVIEDMSPEVQKIATWPLVGAGVDAVFGIFDKTHVAGNADMQVIYDFRKRLDRIAGSMGEAERNYENFGGEETYKLIEKWRDEVYRPDGSMSWTGKMVEILPALDERIKELQNINMQIKFYREYADTTQLKVGFDAFREMVGDTKTNPNQSESYMRGYMIKAATVQRNDLATAIRKEIESLPKDDEELIKMTNEMMHPEGMPDDSPRFLENMTDKSSLVGGYGEKKGEGVLMSGPYQELETNSKAHFESVEANRAYIKAELDKISGPNKLNAYVDQYVKSELKDKDPIAALYFRSENMNFTDLGTNAVTKPSNGHVYIADPATFKMWASGDDKAFKETIAHEFRHVAVARMIDMVEPTRPAPLTSGSSEFATNISLSVEQEEVLNDYIDLKITGKKDSDFYASGLGRVTKDPLYSQYTSALDRVHKAMTTIAKQGWKDIEGHKTKKFDKTDIISPLTGLSDALRDLRQYRIYQDYNDQKWKIGKYEELSNQTYMRDAD